jgi:nucleoid-associated protein YgaU
MGLQKATLTNVSTYDAEDAKPVEVLFNPTEYSVTTNMNYAAIDVPGLRMPLLQFVRGESRVMSVELFLDYSDRDQTGKTGIGKEIVSAALEAVTGSGLPQSQTDTRLETQLAILRKYVTIDKELHAPPIVKFSWGDGRDFTGVVTEFSETFLMFNEMGDVIRARVKLSIKSYEAAELQYRALDLQSPNHTRTRVVKEGERLDTIAMEEYGNPTEWRTLAEANDIARPRLIKPGDVLVIPPL